MSIKTLTLRASALALFTTVALVAAQPASATTAKVATASSTSSEIGAARRHHRYDHQVRRSTTVRNAFGAYEGSGPAAPAQTWNNYGYGVGDNARNQTW